MRETDLLAAPEMKLIYPNETDARIGDGADEGVGNGFDQGSPRAYAERWFSTSDDPARVQRWFHDQLSALGWTIVSDNPRFQTFSRDSDETIGVAPSGGTVRVHFEVEGRWPDGSTGYRPA